MTTHTEPQHRRRAPRALVLALPLALLAACGGTDQPAAPGAASTSPTAAGTAPTEREAAAPRLVLTYDGGLVVLDATTLETVGSAQLDGFTRVNPAGDGRHVYVSTTGGFRVLDAGTWAQPHGDHAHYYTAAPVLTDQLVPAQEPGHVVVHEGRTALFDDATGHVVVHDSDATGDPDRAEREHTAPTPHHGVAVELTDGTLVVSEGTADARTGVRVLDADGSETAASDACPGVHGEAVAADEAVVVGCEDGVLVLRDGKLTKVEAPDAYGRIGNQAGTEASPIVLGDYKSDPDAELERPTRVSLVDTRDASLRLVDLPASYTFRSLARGEDGEALVLGTDGALHVIDPQTGELVRSVPVVEPWEEPTDWQQPRPAVKVLGGTAYVTDPARSMVHAVDVLTGEVWRSVSLDVVPNELAVATGEAAHEHEQDEHEQDEHAHDEHADDEHAHDEHADDEGAGA
ncbi:zinc metallochaperone AztD [Cellulomonas sp.]|uniref:zinc metallochaperone AztD n=1 Tax=Cellulomonas sp. TaxID=40001 RepID=UPI002583B4C3|nr:zinc metallochaperone AztD [Cellulomonas sp.]MCR6690360.1 zinc metallochaperone AztD [Cellulomonas sp.]